MSMGKRSDNGQGDLWIAATALPRTAGHPFYERLNAVLKKHGIDAFAEAKCAKYYAEKMSRPSIPPGVYFRMLFVGTSRALTPSGGSHGGWPIRWPCGSFYGIGSTNPRRTIRAYRGRGGG